MRRVAGLSRSEVQWYTFAGWRIEKIWAQVPITVTACGCKKELYSDMHVLREV